MDNKWGTNFEDNIYKTFSQLVSIKSDTGTVLEKDVEEYLYKYIKSLNYFQLNQEFCGIYKLENDYLNRGVVWGLVKGKGEDTIILMHHHDVVDAYDYGSLSIYANNPEKLQETLKEVKLSDDVMEDLESGEWVFGRGTADMKAGAAIQLELLKKYSEEKEFNGNLLLLSVPDEESLSIGMRESISLLERLKEKFHLSYKLLINSEPHSREKKDTGILYEGSVGKLMPVVYVRGKKTHIGNVFQGFNPVSLLSQIVRKTELNTMFCDVVGKEISPPPSWVYFRDRKEVYDASMPPSVGGYFSILSLYRTPKESLELLKRICEDAFDELIQDMNKHYKDYIGKAGIEDIDLPWNVNVRTFSDIYHEAVRNSGDDFIKEYNKTMDRVINDIENGTTNLQESSFTVIEKVLEFIDDLSPMVVIAFSPPYYPAVANIDFKNLPTEILKLSEEISDFSEKNWGEKYEKQNYFMGISDMSYIALNNGEEVIPYIEPNMPLWGRGYIIPFSDIENLSMPGINIGPWGKDIHKFTERVRKKDLLETCPKLIAYAIDYVLS